MSEERLKDMRTAICGANQAALRALSNLLLTSKIVKECRNRLGSISEFNMVELVWVLGRCGAEENSQAMCQYTSAKVILSHYPTNNMVLARVVPQFMPLKNWSKSPLSKKVLFVTVDVKKRLRFWPVYWKIVCIFQAMLCEY